MVNRYVIILLRTDDCTYSFEDVCPFSSPLSYEELVEDMSKWWHSLPISHYDEKQDVYYQIPGSKLCLETWDLSQTVQDGPDGWRQDFFLPEIYTLDEWFSKYAR